MKLVHAVILMMSMTPAIAFANPQPEGPGAMFNLLFFGGFILIFYFLMWRPQAKRAKEHKELMASLSKGDEVVTNGGVAGKITRVKDDFIVIEVADNVEIKVQRVAVSAALPKGTLKEV
ncbi:MAG: preprotein translocase subunit YajC [Gammaproteobacteria bacterium]|nr:MAG: preprotein translocase subunit YajC [Gammaproteobacteria bacterium]